MAMTVDIYLFDLMINSKISRRGGDSHVKTLNLIEQGYTLGARRICMNKFLKKLLGIVIVICIISVSVYAKEKKLYDF